MTDDIKKDIELKKYCIEQAQGTPDLVRVSRELYEFLISSPIKQRIVTQPQIVRKWLAPEITKTQKAALSVCLNLRAKGELINGISLSKALKCTQSNASSHLRSLVKKKYLRREGNKFFAVLGVDGRELPPIIEKCPPGVAKGFKPMTVKLGDMR